ncbi:MAG: hypothetical protein ABH834_04050 [Candidatus Altiarchaeota archaeon]
MIQDPEFTRKAGILLRLEKKLSMLHASGRLPEKMYLAKKQEVEAKLAALKKKHTDLVLAKLVSLDNGKEEFENLLHSGNISQDNFDSFIEKLSGEKTEVESERDFIKGLNEEEYVDYLRKEVKVAEEDEAAEKEKKAKTPKVHIKLSFPALLGVFVAIILLFIVFIPWNYLTDPVLMELDMFTTTMGVRPEYLTTSIYTTSVYTTTGLYTTTSLHAVAPPKIVSTTIPKTTTLGETTITRETTTVKQIIETTTTSKTRETGSTSLPTTERVYLPATEDSRFGFMHPQEAYMMARSVGVSWERPHEGPFIWNEIQPAKGSYNWKKPDSYVKYSQSYGFNILATIWPFATWDQKTCHSERECRGYGFDGKGELPTLRCKPCDMGAYYSFVRALVERYDGDGVNDMPGLKYPIKYWEAGNEPEMQGNELSFFKGNSNDYLDVLKETYTAVKEADAEAKVLHAGLAGMGDDTRRFWGPVFSSGSGFFDIANVHSVGGDDDGLFVEDMRSFMSEHGVNKPLWVTEAQYNGRDGSESSEEFASLLARSMVYAFGNGAEKIFYTGLTSPSPGHDNAALLTLSGSKTPVYYSYHVLVDKLDYFEGVERISGSQYRFTVGRGDVWVLWGSGSVPGDLSGIVKVTDVEGGVEVIDAGEITLSDSPVFVERLE